jgi:hypothetical protein
MNAVQLCKAGVTAENNQLANLTNVLTKQIVTYKMAGQPAVRINITKENLFLKINVNCIQILANLSGMNFVRRK